MGTEIDRLEEKRHCYARHITELGGIDRESSVGREICRAFESVPREDFVGPPPWTIVSTSGSVQSATSSVLDLYEDVLVALNPGRGLNNGQPSLHAYCLNALALEKGESAVHVGMGAGYYTAILGLLAGESGHVDGFEIEPELARQAASNLSGLRQVDIHDHSGAEAPIPNSDVVYVSAACAEPVDVWLDALRIGGRLLFPLEPEGRPGQMLLVTKCTDRFYRARFLGGVQFVGCVGAQNRAAAEALEAAFRRGNWGAVRSLRRDDEPDESCWVAGPGWWLSTDD